MLVALVIVGLIVGAMVVFVVGGFNKLRKADIGAQEALGGIDVQLTRRAELIPNLLETVKGYAAHEESLLKEITAARAGLQSAAQSPDVQAKVAADEAMGAALSRLNVVVENYPDLKASANFQELQRALADTENQISFARQYYNDAVATLNNATQTIPTMWLTGLAGVSKREFYRAPEANIAPPKVEF